MNTRSVWTRAATVLAVVAASLCFAAPAIAGNTSQSSWSAYLTSWNTSDTPNRQKQDTSNGFIRADHVSGGRTIRAWMLGYSNEDVRSGTVTLQSGTSGYVTNQAYQLFDGPKQVHMRLQNTQYYSTGTEAAGVWSPDSR
ncbi:hypothetical protein [Bifidobacterium phasiani]|uniref:Uncharacterized protein n=1 Tax=Bifidobacterium phasiani TaxID=2834431 RepID=A0ABS6W724_9BIFI|nr:hypothetical protein [Bifidobacterium phasiani]MBW3082300.1 hypothetical protein [Bifidobacterium phasiani]